MFRQFRGWPDWTTYQFTAAVGADEVEFLRGTLEAEGTLEGADERVGGIGRQIPVATLAVGAEFEGHRVLKKRSAFSDQF
jgi:hypothetical protein